MSEGYWWAAYVLAGIIAVMIFLKSLEYFAEHEDDPSERRKYELMFTAMKAQPQAKAFLCITLWVFWPLLFISFICLTTAFYAADFYYGVKKHVRSFRMWKRNKMGSQG